jgi:hypothetical protein
MADQQAPAPDDLRRDVRTALQSRRMDSVTKACKVVVGLATICSVGAVAANALGMFTVGWLVALGLITIAGGAWAYAMNEHDRLGRHSELLRELLQSEKYYENLLRTKNDEVQAAERIAHQLQTRLDVVMAVRELIKVDVREVAGTERAQKSLPPESGEPQNG